MAIPPDPGLTLYLDEIVHQKDWIVKYVKICKIGSGKSRCAGLEAKRWAIPVVGLDLAAKR